MVVVKAENKDNALIAALIAALSSSRAADFITKNITVQLFRSCKVLPTGTIKMLITGL